MIKKNVNESNLTLDNSQIQLVRKESKDSWYKYTYEDEGSLTPVSAHDEMPLNVLDTKTKFRTFRNTNMKTLLDTAYNSNQGFNNDSNRTNERSPQVDARVQNLNDIEKWEEIDIQFKESVSSGAKLYNSPVEIIDENEADGCLRMLHKMVSNTLKHYKIDSVYDADDIMRIYRNNGIDK